MTKYGPSFSKEHGNDNPAERFLKFIQMLTLENQISKAEIKSILKIGDTAF